MIVWLINTLTSITVIKLSSMTGNTPKLLFTSWGDLLVMKWGLGIINEFMSFKKYKLYLNMEK